MATVCAFALGLSVPAPALASDSPLAFGSRPYARLFDAPPRLLLPQQVGPEGPHPPPRRSGFSVLIRTTGSDFATFPRRQSTWVILAIGGGAAAMARPFDVELNEQLKDADGLRAVLRPGKYLGYAWVQGGAAAGIYLIGRYAMARPPGGGTNKVAHLGFDLVRANLITQGLTYGIKYAVQRNRPTGECCSFPSGHASVTFATAAVLERHLGYRASWPMFVIAGAVSASRLTDNRHYLSDVLFGSALGMAAGWTVVGRHGRDDFAIFPVPLRRGVALSGTWSPGRRG
jgi:membrane-associated phospholipid phosphatase